MNYQDSYNLAREIAFKAGVLTLEYWNKLEVAVEKKALDIATNADLAVEDLIVSEIKKVYPDHNFLTEEHSTLDQGSSFTWVIDPIDGTKNYFHHISMFCNSIALREGEKEVVGVVYNPVTGEIFSAYKRGGCFCRDVACNVSTETNLEKALLYVELPNHSKTEYESMNAKLQKLQPSCYRLRSFGSAELALAYVASGSFDAYVDLSLTTQDWDWAAGACLVREAGGEYRALSNGVRMAGNTGLLGEISNLLAS